jgi:hypothetical protein
MTYYLAGRYEDRRRLNDRAMLLDRMGYTRVASWLDRPEAPTLSPADEFRLAALDLSEVAQSRLFILDTMSPGTRGGREVEYGAALAVPLLTVVIGPQRNIFHAIAIHGFPSWAAAMPFFHALIHEDGTWTLPGSPTAPSPITFRPLNGSLNPRLSPWTPPTPTMPRQPAESFRSARSAASTRGARGTARQTDLMEFVN